MFWLGKIIGLIIGWKIAGFFGLLLGLMIGHFIDQWRRLKHSGFGFFFHDLLSKFNLQEDFLAIVFQVMGYVADSADAAEQVMKKMHLTTAQCLLARQQFAFGQSAQFQLPQALSELKQLSRSNPLLIRIFIDLQLQAADRLSTAKQQRLFAIFSQIGFIPFNFNFEQQHDYRQGATYRSTTRTQLDNAYHILGIHQNATLAEVKNAYRRLMSKHHPDKLSAQGLSAVMLKLATEKAQEIQLAYDLIQRHLAND